MSEKHTPGPWKAFNEHQTVAILDSQGNEVVFWLGFDNSDRPHAEHVANAERIVQCVNAHDELVVLLQAYLARQRGEYSDIGHEELAERADAAIAKATGSAT